jgi:hypothetical integral membrane protein (TIGR02206 family)
MLSSFREEIRKYMQGHEQFVQWSASHLWAMGISLLCIIFIPLLAKKYLNTKTQDRLGSIIGCSIAGAWILWTILEITAGTFDVRRHLPLQLCRFSNLAIVMVLVWKRQWWYEILYFWALAGMLQATVTPDLQEEFPHFMYFRYWIGHPGMILAIVYATVVYGMRPWPRHIVKAMLALNVFLLVAIVVNLSIDANYLFICKKPPTASLLDHLGPWPWYILGAELAACANFALAYVPWLWIDRRKAALRNPDNT